MSPKSDDVISQPAKASTPAPEAARVARLVQELVRILRQIAAQEKNSGQPKEGGSKDA